MAVTVSESPSLTLGARRVLFDGPYVTLGLGGHQSMSVSPDGKRFVLLKRMDEDSRLIVTTNWFNELRAKVGAKKRRELGSRSTRMCAGWCAITGSRADSWG
jgi:hypothetical protein